MTESEDRHIDHRVEGDFRPLGPEETLTPFVSLDDLLRRLAKDGGREGTTERNVHQSEREPGGEMHGRPRIQYCGVRVATSRKGIPFSDSVFGRARAVW